MGSYMLFIGACLFGFLAGLVAFVVSTLQDRAREKLILESLKSDYPLEDEFRKRIMGLIY